MSTVDKNPVIKTRSGKSRGRLAGGVIDESELKARVNETLNRWPTVGLAVGVVRDGRLAFFRGHGLADIAPYTPVTEDTVFRIASITKTFTAIAVMQLWEQGLIDLDAPANDYLRAYKLIPARASFRPATVRHLLTHTAGIREVLHPSGLLRMRDLGETVPFGQPVPSLAEYYRGGLRIDAEPGSRFMYTNHGFATLGQIVEDVSREPLERYLREHIFEPLGMDNTDLVRSERVQSHLATGYDLHRNGARAVTDYAVVTVGGGGIYSTTRDMARYMAALLGGGASEYGQVLKPETMAMMFEPHYRPDARMPGNGLAFFRFNLGGHLAVEHDGILLGFDSQIFLAPDDGVGVMAFANGARRGFHWLTPEVGGILRHLLGVPDEEMRTDVPQHPEIWGDLCGWYHFSAHLTDPTKLAFGAGVEVFVRRGQPMMRILSPILALYRGFPLHPDDDNDPYIFRIDLSTFSIGTGRVIFSRELRRQWELQLEHARYEARLAQRKYDAVDPDNRLVAAELERRWNAQLTRVAELEQAYAKAEQEANFTLTPEERAAMQTLAQDLEAIWQAETTTQAERKQLLRLAIASVQLDGVSRPGWIEIQIRWRSGVVTRLEVKRAQPGEGSLKTPEQAVARIHELAAESSYAQIAEELNAEGWRTAFGRPFNSQHVGYICRRDGCGRKGPCTLGGADQATGREVH
jgi:CubicO group peptidase (beta-lactamase class C family)